MEVASNPDLRFDCHLSVFPGATAAAGSVTYVLGLGEDEPTKVFNFIGAFATIAFAYSIVIIPEIQVLCSSHKSGSECFGDVKVKEVSRRVSSMSRCGR